MRKEFPRTTPESVGLRSEDIEWLLDRLENGWPENPDTGGSKAPFTEPHGLMIMRHDKVCAEGWWHPYGPELRHGQQSHSKAYAATAVGVAQAEGLLDLDERLVDIFPEEQPDPAKSGLPEEELSRLSRVTIRHLLCMGVGMEEMRSPADMDPRHLVRDFLTVPVVHEPGTRFMYNSMASCMLVAVLRAKTGLSLEEYLGPRMFEPLGIHAGNHRWAYCAEGIEAGGGGLQCELEDDLRLMKLYKDGGVWEGRRILREDFVREAISAMIDNSTEEAVNPGAWDNYVGYGYQLWCCRPAGVYRADGACGQFTVVVPDLDMMISISENAWRPHAAQLVLDLFWEYLARVREHLHDGPDTAGGTDGTAGAQTAPAPSESPSGKLAARLRSLALPVPACAPRSPLENLLEGSSWKITEGLLTLDDLGMLRTMIPQGTPPVVDCFSLHFTPSDAVFSYCTPEKAARQLLFAMDGTEKENLFTDSLCEKVLGNARWSAPDTLVLQLRWLHACNVETLTLHFTDAEGPGGSCEITEHCTIDMGQEAARPRVRAVREKAQEL